MVSKQELFSSLSCPGCLLVADIVLPLVLLFIVGGSPPKLVDGMDLPEPLEGSLKRPLALFVRFVVD